MRGVERTVATVLCLGGGVLVVSCPSTPPGHPTTEAPAMVVEMISALAERRWVEPRLSATSAYGPRLGDCPLDRLLCEPRFAPATAPEPGRHNVQELVSSWVQAAAAGSARDHAEALLALARTDGTPGQRRASAEKAVRMLEILAGEHPLDVRIHSDLAAAYFVRAQRLERPVDLIRALEAVEKAVALDSRWPDARWNQAQIHGALALKASARRSWERYLELDPSSPWAEEARQRSGGLDGSAKGWDGVAQELERAALLGDVATVGRLIASRRSAARRHVERTVLPDWAKATSSGDEVAAGRHLAVARRIALVLAELGGDRLLVDTVDAIDAASLERRRELAEGHRAYAEGLRQKVASGPFEMAFHKLEGSPFQSWARVGLATCHFYAGDHVDALELLESLEREIEIAPGSRQDYANLLGHVSWMTALFKTFQTRPLEALRDYQEAQTIFEATGERENVFNIHSRQADLLATLGEQEGAWQHRYRALRKRDLLQQPGDKIFLLNEVSGATLELGLTASARLFENEALGLARETGQAPLLVAALLHHAETDLRSEAPEHLLRDLAEVAELLSDVPELRRVVTEGVVSAWSLEVRSDALLAEDPLRSIELLTRALQQTAAGTYLPYRARLLSKRARAFRESRQIAAASADVEASVAVLEEEWTRVLAQRQRGEHEQIWPAYFAHRRETFDLVIELLVEQGEPGRALDFAERARARDLLDLVASPPAASGGGKPVRPRTEVAIRQALPAGRVLVEYALLDDRLLLWEIRREGTRLHLREVARPAIDGLVRTIDRAFNERDTAADSDGALAKLHELLIQPLLGALKDGEEIVFVPDGSLHGVPFAALYNAATGRFLIEDHVLSVAPSATLHLLSLRRDRQLRRSQAIAPKVLLVADPAFDSDLFPDLETLPEAVLEIRQIAPYYPGSLSLEGSKATKPRLLAELGGYDVVHFAGHAIPNVRAPHRSSLVLAPSAQESGVLYAEELLRKDFGRARLVVLSACSTAGGKAIGSLTMTGLVRPLLGAGVPAVVGTLWDVRSGATSLLLTSFYRHLSAGESAARALRSAQLEMIRGNLAQREVESWAPFQVIGVASFDDVFERSLP